MQTVIRYTVVNQDGKPVIRAVPVRRWSEDRDDHAEQPVVEEVAQPAPRKLRRFRVLDNR